MATPKEKVEPRAQEIQDMFFALGAKVSKKEWDSLCNILISIRQQGYEEGRREERELEFKSITSEDLIKELTDRGYTKIEVLSKPQGE